MIVRSASVLRQRVGSDLASIWLRRRATLSRGLYKFAVSVPASVVSTIPTEYLGTAAMCHSVVRSACSLFEAQRARSCDG